MRVRLRPHRGGGARDAGAEEGGGRRHRRERGARPASERSKAGGSGARRVGAGPGLGGRRTRHEQDSGGLSARTRARSWGREGSARPPNARTELDSGVGTQRNGVAAANQRGEVSRAGQSARGSSPVGQSAAACGILPQARESTRPVPEPQPISAQEPRAASGRGLGDVLQAHRARPRQLRSRRHQQQRQSRPWSPARRHECSIAIRICPWSLCPLPAPLQRLWPPVHGLRAGHEAARFSGLPEHIH